MNQATVDKAISEAFSQIEQEFSGMPKWKWVLIQEIEAEIGYNELLRNMQIGLLENLDREIIEQLECAEPTLNY